MNREKTDSLQASTPHSCSPLSFSVLPLYLSAVKFARLFVLARSLSANLSALLLLVDSEDILLVTTPFYYL